MAHNGWYSKKDMINDLSHATGAPYNVDESYVVKGKGPPPQQRILDDEQKLQIQQLCGGYKTSGPIEDIDMTPDLQGITEMIRMVDRYNEELECAHSENEPLTKNVISISKLDPKVDEFVPRGNISRTSQEFNAVVDEHSTDSKEKKENDDSQHKNEMNETEACNSSPSKLSTTTSSANAEEIRELKDKLKSKINDTSEPFCIKKKKERNLAIAMLIKLHTEANDELPKLYTPDYFARSLSKNKEPNQNETTSQTNDNVEVEVTSALMDTDCTNCFDTPSVDTSTSTDIHKNNKNQSPNSSTFDHYPKYMKESISKVNNWLNNKPIVSTEHPSLPIKLPSPIYLGPIAFKRKNNSFNNHIQPSDSNESKKSSHQSNVFVPSSFASELTKKYEERNSEMNEPKLDIWATLQKELKVKDKAIKEKQSEKNSD